MIVGGVILYITGTSESNVFDYIASEVFFLYRSTASAMTRFGTSWASVSGWRVRGSSGLWRSAVTMAGRSYVVPYGVITASSNICHW